MGEFILKISVPQFLLTILSFDGRVKKKPCTRHMKIMNKTLERKFLRTLIYLFFEIFVYCYSKFEDKNLY